MRAGRSHLRYRWLEGPGGGDRGDALEEGGYIFVHDVSAGGEYDGAGQAYHEFTARMDLPPTMVGDNCGLIRKQLVTAR